MKHLKQQAAIVRRLTGRVVTEVALNTFQDGRGHEAYTPEIKFDDGSVLHFYVQETEVGEYGIRLMLHCPKEIRGDARDE